MCCCKWKVPTNFSTSRWVRHLHHPDSTRFVQYEFSVLFLCIAEFQQRTLGNQVGGLDSNVANVIDTGKAVAPTLSECGFHLYILSWKCLCPAAPNVSFSTLSARFTPPNAQHITAFATKLTILNCSESSPHLMEKCRGNAIRRHGSQCLEVFHSVDLRQCYTTVLIFMDLALRNRKVRKIHRRFPEIESHGIS